MEPVNLCKWVNDNNPSPNLSYGKGWWDYVECLYHLDELYGPQQDRTYSTSLHARSATIALRSQATICTKKLRSGTFL
jgi:hypothetical protein